MEIDNPISQIYLAGLLPRCFILLGKHVERLSWPSSHLLYGIIRSFLHSAGSSRFQKSHEFCIRFWQALTNITQNSFLSRQFNVHNFALQTAAEFFCYLDGSC